MSGGPVEERLDSVVFGPVLGLVRLVHVRSEVVAELVTVFLLAKVSLAVLIRKPPTSLLGLSRGRASRNVAVRSQDQIIADSRLHHKQYLLYFKNVSHQNHQSLFSEGERG